MGEPSGVVLPVNGPDGARSSSALGRAVVAEALRPVDPVGARAAEHETNWRGRYLVHFRRLVEAGLTDAAAARRIATAGLAALHDRMRFRPPRSTADGDRAGHPADRDPAHPGASATPLDPAHNPLDPAHNPLDPAHDPLHPAHDPLHPAPPPTSPVASGPPPAPTGPVATSLEPAATLVDELPLAGALDREWPVEQPLGTAVVAGTAEPERELAVPYRGRWLRGAALSAQLDRWVEAGVIEPSCAEAVRRVADHPQWLALPGRTVVALGAGAEMGPVPALLRWGAEVVAVDLPGRAIWGRLLAAAARGAGRMLLPVRRGAPAAYASALGAAAGPGSPPAPGAGGGPASRSAAGPDLLDIAGADLLTDLPAVARWLSGLDGRMVLGNYAYADGAAHVRLAAAADALGEYLRATRGELAWSFLATPTDVYAVPAEVVAYADRAYRRRRAWSRAARWLSAGRLLRRNYPPDADPGVIDCLVPQQGPNYALAKRVQRWRATVARARGDLVSLTVAPMTRTRSVLKNRLLAAAYAGAHRFGVEVFDPDTSNTLMAALLVHDLCCPSPPAAHPWRDEAARAAHSGVWRVAYAPRSALGLAALAGLGARS